MPRFAILAHDFPAPHWDLFLEAGPVLRSWRLPAPLSPGVAVPAEPAADHRLFYLDYEGPVSGNRGSVCRVDAGQFTTDVEESERILLRLAGTRFVGRLILNRAAGVWACTFLPD
jgi:DNA polymerase Ligase (LigD)